MQAPNRAMTWIWDGKHLGAQVAPHPEVLAEL